ncbi:hypothetical protein KA001_03640 [Patescibacteria group bacterium]|nr:hypothetical protein [Patescibacteria group bacterium]
MQNAQSANAQKSLPTVTEEQSSLYKTFKNVASELYKKNLELNFEHSRLEDILLQVAESIISINNKNKITIFNTSAENTFEIKKDRALNKDADSLIKMYSNKTQKQVFFKDFIFKDYSILSKKSIDNVVFKKSDGSEVYLKLNYRNIIFDKDNKECVVSFTNITHEIEVDKLKDEFISIASHELKTPIIIIKNNLFMFNFSFKDKLSEYQVHLQNEIEKGLVRLSRVVNNLLDISRIEQGRFVLDLKEQNIDEIIEGVYTQFLDLCREKKLKLILSPEKIGNATVDKERLIEVINNLLSNALKYTETGGIRISKKQEKNDIKILITDTGPGIASTDLPKLFKKFGRAKEGLKREEAGASTGLGLYITKKIIEEMGGEVGVKSVVGKGSVFYFTLPKKGKELI